MLTGSGQGGRRDAAKVSHCQSFHERAEVQSPQKEPMSQVRAGKGIHSKVRFVPYLLSRIGKQGIACRSPKSKLVNVLRNKERCIGGKRICQWLTTQSATC